MAATSGALRGHLRYANPILAAAFAPKMLKCPGVGRDKDNVNALQFYFSRQVSDDEMRLLHDIMQRACALAIPAENGSCT